MKNSSEKDLTVYDFKEDDEDIELSSKNMLRKFGMSGNPKTGDSPLTKYHFLQLFSEGSNAQQTEISDVLCIDYDTSDGGEKCNIHGSHIGTSEREFAGHEESSGLNVIPITTSTNYDEHSHISEENFEPGNFNRECLRMGSPAMGSLSLGVTAMPHKQLDRTSSELPSNRGPVLVSDEDDSFGTSSPLTPTSDLSENEADCINSGVAVYHASGHYSSGKMENIDMVVIVSPDYVTYGSIMCKESKLAFSSDCIKLQCMNASGSNKNFGSEWAIVDVVHIECRWSDNVETAWVKILLREPTAIVGAENVEDASGILKLMFVVSDPRWSEKEQKIISLGERYKTLWNVKLDAEMASEDDDFMEKNNMFYSKHYLNYFEEPFEDVIYPKGDPDAVSISKRDIELLQPEIFINDTIIDFYIKYLKNELRPEDTHRFHFFNSFFFRKLVDLDKDPGRALEGRVDFQRVRKWTRKVNIFEKDYIFIPVNFSLHWSLIVICHPGEVAYFKDEEIEKALRVPCILHMDSIKGNHKDLKNLVQSYLWEEWKERHKELLEDFSSKFSNLRFVPLELPQQENSYDCGLFLLHYVELFLEEAPANFNPFRITKLSNFLNLDWFPPAEASYKRSRIQMLIYKLLDDDSQKNHLASCSNGHHSSEFPENDTENEPVVEFLTARCSSPKTCTANSPPGLPYNKDTELGFREMFETGANSGFGFPDGRYPPFSRMTSFSHLDLSPVKEEGEDTDEHFGPSPFGKPDIRRQDGITTELCTTSYSVKDMAECKSPWVPEFQMKEDGDSLSGSSSGESHDSSEAELNELAVDSVGPNQQDDVDKVKSVTPENCGHVSESPVLAPSEKLLTCVIEDCQEADTTVSGSNEDFTESPDLAPIEKLNTCLGEYSQEADTTVSQRNEEVAESPDLVPTEKLKNCVVEDSQEADTTASGSNDGHEKSIFSSQENLPESTEKDDHSRDDVHLIGDDLEMNLEKQPDTTAAGSNEGHEKSFFSSQENLLESTEKNYHSADDVQLIGGDSEINVEKRPPKRRKVYSAHEGERRQTRSLSRD